MSENLEIKIVCTTFVMLILFGYKVSLAKIEAVMLRLPPFNYGRVSCAVTVMSAISQMRLAMGNTRFFNC